MVSKATEVEIPSKNELVPVTAPDMLDTVDLKQTAGVLQDENDEDAIKRVETIFRSEVRAYLDDATPEKLTTFDDRTTDKDQRMTVS